jgi:hypothetical protein
MKDKPLDRVGSHNYQKGHFQWHHLQFVNHDADIDDDTKEPTLAPFVSLAPYVNVRIITPF